MKNIFFISWIFIIAICISCSDRSYQGIDPETPEEEIKLEDIPILLAVGDPSYSVLTRSVGAFDTLMIGKADTLARDKATFYVYAFANNENVDFTKRANDTEHNPNKDICLVDGTLNKNKPSYDHGKTAIFNQDDYSFLNWADGAAYYNTVHQTLPYNFFAYYVDSLIIKNEFPINMERQPDYIAFNVKIDGRMDLMSAMAAVTEKQQKEIIDIISDPKEKNAMSECRYSAYTAHRKLFPFFRFKHHMAKIHFNLYPGDPLTIDRVYLDTIQMYVNTQGKFTVASKDTAKIKLGISNWTGKEWLLLKEKDGSNLREDYKAVWHDENNDKDKDVYERTPTPVGDCLLIPASNSKDPDPVKIEIRFRQEVEVKEGEETRKEMRYFKTEKTLDNQFKEGYAYNLRIAVFGELEIKLSATIEGWIPGDSIDINPDDDFKY